MHQATHQATGPTSGVPQDAEAILASLRGMEEDLGIGAIIRSADGGVSDGERDAALLALFGRHSDGRPAALPSADRAALAATPIAGDDDQARALARLQRQRGSLAWALATARGARMPERTTFGAASFERIAADPDQLPAAWRPLAQLLDALLADHEGRDALVPLDRLLERKDLRSAERTAARALRAALDQRGGEAADRILASLQETVARTSTIELAIVTEARAMRLRRLGIGDPLAEDPAFDGALEATATNAAPNVRSETPTALRSFLLTRLRLDGTRATTTAILERGSDLRLLANADQVRDHDAAAFVRRLRAGIDRIRAGTAIASIAPLLLFELGRSLSVDGRFDEAYEPFAEVVLKHPNDPLAAAAADLAIMIGLDRHRRAPNAESLATMTALLETAIHAHPTHPERDGWLAAACELACEARDPAAALSFAALMSPSDPRSAAMRVLVARTALAEDADLNDFERAALAGRALAPLIGDGSSPATTIPSGADPATIAWVDALLARSALLDIDGNGGRAGEAKERSIACIGRADAPIEARAHALVTLAEALRRGGEGPDLPRAISATIERDAGLWRTALRAELDGSLERLAAATIDGPRAGQSHRDAAFLAAVAPSLVIELRTDAARRLALARALIAAGRHELVERVFPPLEADSDAIDALLLRAEAMRLRDTSGSRADAMRLFGVVAARSAERSAPWWRAELGQLRTTAQGKTDEAIVAVRARINWLRGIDRTLGGEPVGPAIESLLRSLPDGAPNGTPR